ncbi:MAG: hypothetical protein DMG30_09050 [Acidobacteria bacterium]|nr:MAG: hypothetical protein DMG30_09050 [Acidobacteriota bacterium]
MEIMPKELKNQQTLRHAIERAVKLRAETERPDRTNQAAVCTRAPGGSSRSANWRPTHFNSDCRRETKHVLPQLCCAKPRYRGGCHSYSLPPLPGNAPWLRSRSVPFYEERYAHPKYNQFSNKLQ